MIQPERIHALNERPPRQDASYVQYWMQASQRSRFNHALEHAIDQANEIDLPLLVVFGLMDDYPEANERHYAFMLQGLADVQISLAKRKIQFVCLHGNPPDVANKVARDAAIVVCDRGYTRHQKRWRDEVADAVKCRVVEVESDIVVPVEVTSNKREFAARTIRPKVLKHCDAFLQPLSPRAVTHSSLTLKVAHGRAIDVSKPEAALKSLKLDRSVQASAFFTGGEVAGQRTLKAFVTSHAKQYDEGRREPAGGGTSRLSPYLHFGQISPIEVALGVKNAGKGSGIDAYLEELIVRRELSINYTHFEPQYDEYAALPEWARKTLREHVHDERPVVYSLKQLEACETYDRLWNASMREMIVSGYMHNSMRMYWGKKILEWSKTPEKAFEYTLYLNNKYFIDGRDPAGYTNVAWCFGLHDRPWGRRKIFGTIRYMGAAGLERKFDMEAYVKYVDGLEKREA